ncbi:nucleoside phosphorylase [Senegalia massiliensis]|uniref:nucleoside phosphorylase n=1 Tax=Senegalia massiliensis TaxID=1720316 RepID=UPI0013EF303A|nr:nucleoside phosphorylase [Senegalia massiliensis]
MDVDIETSAMYTLGQYRNIGTCNMLVVSYELWREWNPKFGDNILNVEING